MEDKLSFRNRERLSRVQKEANNFQYYRERIDSYDNQSYYQNNYNGVTERKRMQVNMDLYNNKLDMLDLAYVSKPFGDIEGVKSLGELPAVMANRDISSNRIKSLSGMHMKRSFGYKLMAVNDEATTRKEEAENQMIQEFVIDSIMQPIREQEQLKYAEELNGGKLDPKKRQEILNQIEQEIQAKTPPQIKRYMQRKHQDPAEVMYNQILEYLKKEQNLKFKFDKGFLTGLLTAYFVFYVGIRDGKPVVKTLNPKRFSHHKSPDTDFIEDGEWASYEFRMQYSELVREFELDDNELDEIFSHSNFYAQERILDSMFTDRESTVMEEIYDRNYMNTVRVLHVVWKGLRKVGWLTYMDENGDIQEKFLVDESYKLNKEAGDISIKWEWIPQVEEGYKIGSKIYKGMGPVKGQHKDPDKLKECKLPYYGAIMDNLSSQPTCPMDRMKFFQYLANIIWYRIELLMASDKGKKLLMNINAIPESEGIDIKKWQYFFESTPFGWFNPDEEGANINDINAIAKVVDMSLVSNINAYIDLFNQIDQACGRAVGITDSVLGQTAISEKVGNNQQNLVQTSYILEPYFDLYNHVKKNVMQGLLNSAKTAYIGSELKRLVYTMDDMSSHIIDIDLGLLENTTIGIFIEDAAGVNEIKENMRQLSHAAMQNGTVQLSDMISLMKDLSLAEMEETLRAAEDTKAERDQQAAEAERKHQAELEQAKRDEAEVAHERRLEEIRVTEEERRKTKMDEMAMTNFSFNPEKDSDHDGKLDFLEYRERGINAEIAIRKENREDMMAQATIKNNEEKLKIEKMKASKGSNSK